MWDGLALVGDAAGVVQVVDVQQPRSPLAGHPGAPWDTAPPGCAAALRAGGE